MGRGAIGRQQRTVGLGADRRRPRDHDPRLATPQVTARVRVVGDDDVEHLEHVGHGPGVRDDDVHGGDQRPVPADGDHPARRGIGAQRIVGGRRPATGPGLLPQPEGGETRGGGGSGAVGGTRSERRGQIVGVVGAFGPAVETALHSPLAISRHVGQADQYGAASAEPLDGERIPLGNEVLERVRAGGGGQSGDQIAVLGRVRDAVKGAAQLSAGPAPIRGRRFGERIGVEDHHRVETRAGPVVGLDPAQIGLHQLHTGHPALVEG